MNDNNDSGMTRRMFLQRLGIVGAVGSVLALAGCNDDDEDSSQTDGTAAVIGTNHGHTATITSAQLQAGAAVTILLTNGEDHSHTVGLSATQVQSIAAGGSITKTSSSNAGHTHSVTFG